MPCRRSSSWQPDPSCWRCSRCWYSRCSHMWEATWHSRWLMSGLGAATACAHRAGGLGLSCRASYHRCLPSV